MTRAICVGLVLLALGLSQCAGPGQPQLAPLRAAAVQVDEGMAQVGDWNVDTLAAIRTLSLIHI